MPNPTSPSWARLYTLLALGLCVVGLAACAAGMFTVRTVQIVGSGLPNATMIEAAGVTGQNIFTVRSDQIIHRLAGLPAVEVTRVETHFPDRVVIYALMRQPAIIWQAPHGASFVDRYGHVLGPAPAVAPGHPPALPVIAGAQPPDAGTITAIGYARRLLPPAPDGALAGFSLDNNSGLTIHGQSGWQAVIGRGDPQTLVSRIATLQALLSQIARNGRHLSFADLRFRGQYYRLRSP